MASSDSSHRRDSRPDLTPEGSEPPYYKPEYYSLIDEEDVKVVDFLELLEPGPDAEEQYCRAVIESDGFNVPGFPPSRFFDGIMPMCNAKSERDRYLSLARAALNRFNEERETKYVVKEVVNATHQTVSGRNYFITFEGKEAKTGAPATFEAFVHQNFNDEHANPLTPTKIIFCRFKGERGESAVRMVCNSILNYKQA